MQQHPPACLIIVKVLCFRSKKEGTKPECLGFQGLSDLVLLLHNNPYLSNAGARHLCFASALPARGASGHSFPARLGGVDLCLGAACTGCIIPKWAKFRLSRPLPRRCLHGVHLMLGKTRHRTRCFASALPARGASISMARSAKKTSALPRRCLHGVHRQKPTNCGTPFCSIRRESVDSFSEINNKDSCADYFPALFCCQGDLHHHYRQPRTDNRPVLRCEQHRLFLFILSSHYRRLL